MRRRSPVWGELVCCASDLHPAELFDDIAKAYGDELVDPAMVGFDDIERDLAAGREAMLTELGQNPHKRLINDTVEEIGWWHCFQEEERESATDRAYLEDDFIWTPPTSTIRRTEPKIGRNERCPCGSGIKYKKCCGR